jgi:Bacteriocin-protection, YdeI or OmpD-Associated/Domain of unknown function (DUF1905)
VSFQCRTANESLRLAARWGPVGQIAGVWSYTRQLPLANGLATVKQRVDVIGRVLIVGVNPYVYVSPEQVTTLRSEWRRPLPVLVWINEGSEAPWRTNLMPTAGGPFRLYLHGAMRATAKVQVGDEVRIGLEVDDEYDSKPAHSMPPWLRSEIDADSRVSENWLKLSPSQRKEVVRYLGALKSDEARERNLQRVLSVLRGEPGRFLGRDWVDGR